MQLYNDTNANENEETLMLEDKTYFTNFIARRKKICECYHYATYCNYYVNCTLALARRRRTVENKNKKSND